MSALTGFDGNSGSSLWRALVRPLFTKPKKKISRHSVKAIVS